MREQTFENFIVNDKNKKAFEGAKNFIVNDKGLFLWGNCGSGKTHLMKSTYRVSGGESIFISATDLLIDLRDSFKKNSEWSEKEIINSLTTNLDFLFLDDFGCEKITDYGIQSICLILDKWEQKEKSKIFITSNLTLTQISDGMGDRISSRIMGLCDVIELNDKDWRGDNGIQ